MTNRLVISARPQRKSLLEKSAFNKMLMMLLIDRAHEGYGYPRSITLCWLENLHRDRRS